MGRDWGSREEMEDRIKVYRGQEGSEQRPNLRCKRKEKEKGGMEVGEGNRQGKKQGKPPRG